MFSRLNQKLKDIGIYIWPIKMATSYEIQIGRLWLRVLRPSFINRRSWRSIFRVTIVNKDGTVPTK